MSIRLTPTQNRLLAVGLLLVVITLVIALFAIPTIWLHKRYDSFIEDYSDKLSRYRRVAALRPAVESSLDELLKQDGRKYFLHATAPTLATAELQGMVTRIVESKKGRIISSQVLPQKEEPKTGEPVKVTIHIQLNASVVPIQLIVHALESNLPYLYVEKMVLASNHGRAYKPEPGVQPEYGIQLTVSAYALPEEARP